MRERREKEKNKNKLHCYPFVLGVYFRRRRLLSERPSYSYSDILPLSIESSPRVCARVSLELKLFQIKTNIRQKEFSFIVYFCIFAHCGRYYFILLFVVIFLCFLFFQYYYKYIDCVLFFVFFLYKFSV